MTPLSWTFTLQVGAAFAQARHLEYEMSYVKAFIGVVLWSWAMGLSQAGKGASGSGHDGINISRPLLILPRNCTGRDRTVAGERESFL
jgi:hypothetical protein